MKLDHIVDTELLSDDDLQGQDYGIAADGMGMAIRAFYQYARPIDAIVREVASNCFDAHREAAKIPNFTDDELRALGFTGDLEALKSHFRNWKERDVEIELVSPQTLGDLERKIIFRDFGVGISPARMRNIMTKFFSSTKRTTNEFIGAFGLGSKSPLGYTNAFTMITWFFGKRYEYLIHSGTTAPRLELLGVEEDNRVNGTEVIIPIENESDYYDFKRAVKIQLRYFDGFIIKGLDVESSIIYRGNNFVYKNDSEVDQLHICFGKVYYPLDFAAVGISSYEDGKVPIGLHFHVGELPVVWNRESLEYTVESKKLILNRLVAAKEELKKIWNDRFSNIKTAEQYVLSKSQKSNQAMILPGTDVDVPHMDQFFDMEIIWPNRPNATKDPLYMWEISKVIKEGKTQKSTSYGCSIAQALTENIPFFFTEANVSKPNINNWLFEGKGYEVFYLIKRKMPLDPDSSRIKNFTGLQWQVGKKDWIDDEDRIDFVATCLEIEEFLKEKSKGYYEDMVVPDEWAEKLRERRKLRSKAAASVPKNQIEIRAKQILTLRPFSSAQCGGFGTSFYILHTTIGEIESHKGLIIYGTQEEIDKLTFAQEVIFQMGYSQKSKIGWKDQTILVVKVARSTMRVLDEIVNAQHVTSFLTTPSGFWRRWLTCSLLLSAWPAGTDIFNTYSHYISHMDRGHKLLTKLRTYVTQFNSNYSYYSRSKEIMDELQKQLMQLEHWDHDIVRDFWSLKAYTWRWDLLKYINLHHIPSEKLLWIMEQVGMDNPELLYRIHKRKELINQPQEDNNT